MKNTKWLILTLGVLFFSLQDAAAQLTSQHAIGGRFGSATGFTYRYTLAPDRAIEGILNFQSNSKSRRLRLVGLYEFHKPITGDFSWFYGFGGSIGSYRKKAFKTTESNPDGSITIRENSFNSELVLSIDGIIGVEYKIPNTPLAVSADIKPYFDFLQESTIKLFDPFGLSIRYTF